VPTSVDAVFVVVVVVVVVVIIIIIIIIISAHINGGRYLIK
jgi:hypothetical protein